MTGENVKLRVEKRSAPLTEDAVSVSREPVASREGGLVYVDPAEARADQEKTVARFRPLWSQRQFILRVTVAGLILSTVIAFLIPKRFESTARLMPPDQTNSSMAMLAAAASGSAGLGLGSNLGGVAGDLIGLKNSGDLFVGILQSRTVQDDLINRFNLQKLYGGRYLEDARKELEEMTEISADRKSGILTINVTDRSPQRAAAMAQEYVGELNRVVTVLNTSSAHREREFLEDRLGQVKQDLEAAEKNFSEFASKNTALDIPAQGKAMIEAAATLEGKWIAAQTDLQSLKQVYADGNVRVRATQATVEELRRQLDRLGGKSDTTRTPNGQDEQSMYPSIRKLPLLGVSYADLYRNTRIQETIYTTLTQEYEIAKVQEVKETPSVKVLDPPDIPQKKSFPPRLLIMVLGTFLALAFAAVWVFGNVVWQDTDASDPRKLFAQEIFSTVSARIPFISHNGSGDHSANGRSWHWIRRSKDDRSVATSKDDAGDRK